MDNAAIDVERQKLWEAMGDLEQMIHISKTLDEKLEEKAIELGVRHVIDKVVDVHLDDAGYIDYLGCEKSGRVDGDFFVDCSGFNALLLQKTLKVNYKSFKDSLVNANIKPTF